MQLPAYNIRDARETLLPSLLYAVAAYNSMNAVEGAAMPMFNPIKRISPLITVAVTYGILRRIPRMQLLALPTLCMGAAMASQLSRLSVLVRHEISWITLVAFSHVRDVL